MTDDPQDRVLEAVEDFVKLHSAGRAPTVAEFCERFPQEQRAEIESQCRLFLEFDGFVGADVDPKADDGEPKRRLGDFVIESELGRGGMGVVYLAQQVSLRRQVALKVLSPGLSFSSRHVERFRREAAAAARLRHPGIVPIYAHGEVEGTLYYAMEFVPGRDLGEVLDDLREIQRPVAETPPGALSIRPDATYPAEVAELGAQIAEALHSAHGSGIVHRDIKPRNVRIGVDRAVYVLDFGLAKDLARESVSLSGELAGTPHYLSPEQSLAKRAPLDHRTDVFSLGVMLYESLTLEHPFDGEDLPEIVSAICFREPVPIHKLNPQVPRDLETIVVKALEKDPGARYATAAELGEDLRRFLRWEPIHAKPVGLAGRVRKWARRRRRSVVSAAALLVVLLVAAVSLWIVDINARAEAAELMTRAEQRSAAHEFDEANDLATRALAIDESLSPRFRMIQGDQERARQKEINANRLLALASSTLAKDRELALLLALEGAKEGPGAVAAGTVLSALDARVPSDWVRGHEHEVLGVRLSPDGETLVTLSADRHAKLWDVGAGAPELRVTLEGHRHYVVACAFDRAGRWLATGSYDRTVRIWDVATGELVRAFLDGYRMPIVSLAFGPDAGWLAIGSYDRVRVVDPSTGAIVAELEPHERFLETLAVSGDGRHLISVGTDRKAKLWDTATWELKLRFEHDQPLHDAVFAPDGRSFAVGDGGGGVHVFRIGEPRPFVSFHHSDKAGCLRFSPTGRLLASASYDHTVRIWDLEGERELAVLTRHTGAVYHVEFSTDGSLLVSAAGDHTARVVEVATGEELAVLQHDNEVVYAAFDPTGRHVLTNTGRDEVRVWHLDSSRDLLVLRGHDPLCRHVAIDSAGERIATAADDGKVRLWRRSTGVPLHVLGDEQRNVNTVDFDPSGKFVCAALGGPRGRDGGTLRVWDARSGERVHELTGHGGEVRTAFFSGDGARIVSASDDGTVRLWDATTGVELGRLERSVAVQFAILDPTGERLVTIDAEQSVARIWDVATRTELVTLRGHEAPLTWAAFRSDGERVATSSRDGTVRLWNAVRGEPEVVLTGHESRVSTVSFDASGTKVVTAAFDRTARVWDAMTGEETLRVTGHRQPVYAAVFGPRGDVMLTASLDHTARLWPTDPIAAAHRQGVRDLTHAERVRYQLMRRVDIAAQKVVDALAKQHELAHDIVAAIEADTELDDSVREVAIAQAIERGNPSARVLAGRAALMLSAGVEAAVARRALRKAEAAVSLEGDNAEYRTTVGIAHYRLGDYQKALAHLSMARSLEEAKPGGAEPLELAFRAMTLHRLGQAEAASAALDELLKITRGQDDPRLSAIVREATELIQH